jgi:hypothetical protein
LVERVAWNRIDRNRALLAAIADSQARQRIQTSFDAAATARLAQLNARFQELRLALAANRARQPDSQVDLFTTENHLEICIGPIGPKHAPRLPDATIPDHPLQVWINSSGMQSEPELLRTWALLRRTILPDSAGRDGQQLQINTAKGSVPLQILTAAPWIVIAAGEPESTVRVAGRRSVSESAAQSSVR